MGWTNHEILFLIILSEYYSELLFLIIIPIRQSFFHVTGCFLYEAYYPP
ncbi:hypothetical protein B4143_0998 [Bacillus subtilis]|uniref:Uncharacterized protein n=1 Tax=Bacillus subtilis TaxID=1423 RepID=A0A0D1L330_BACIU|nr:hypothetical protein B4146_1877 [Bacillus subtilis]CCU58318.1 hypothetical protein BSUBE1_1687 [Bacillus subtilis E1]KIO55707.1 hypothetical protein B4143_0998 [Bacillus subtilis]KIU12747.1 hypothetical protein SC09_Contig19orf01302 [Bacillus subtilis]KZD95062.1 hypothetical protein B4122_0034 [Bacillus subtilis]